MRGRQKTGRDVGERRRGKGGKKRKGEGKIEGGRKKKTRRGKGRRK